MISQQTAPRMLYAFQNCLELQRFHFISEQGSECSGDKLHWLLLGYGTASQPQHILAQMILCCGRWSCAYRMCNSVHGLYPRGVSSNLPPSPVMTPEISPCVAKCPLGVGSWGQNHPCLGTTDDKRTPGC